MSTCTILVATWGNPWKNPCRDPCDENNLAWMPVRYRIEWNDRIHEDEARSSLKPLHDFLKPDEIHLFVCDTVSCTDDGDSYSKLVESVIRKYKIFISKFLGDEIADRTSVHVIPCFGSFPNGIFITNPLDTYTTLIYRLYGILASTLTKSCDEVILLVDLTHGINYMPTLLYHAIDRITRIASFGKKIRVVVVNSDPYVPSRNVNTYVLRINIVEDIRVPKVLDLTYVSTLRDGPSLKFRPSQRKYAELVRKVNKRFAECKLEKLLNLYATVYIGAPLAVHTYMPGDEELNMFRECLNEYFKLYNSEDNVIVTCSNNMLRVERLMYMDPQIQFIIESLMLAESLSASGISHNREPSLDALEETRNIISWSKNIDCMISNDLYGIKKLLCTYILKKAGVEDEKAVRKCIDVLEELMRWNALSDIAKEVERVSREFQVRNFIAHSGLEYNVTKIKLDIKLSYEPKAKSNIEKALKDAVRLRK